MIFKKKCIFCAILILEKKYRKPLLKTALTYPVFTIERMMKNENPWYRNRI